MGIRDPKRIYDTADLAPGNNIIFACTGVTTGSLLRGVRFFGDGIRTHSLVLTMQNRQVRFVDTVHLDQRPDVRVTFY
jgi:fructose-1,6-bisphosphatase/sedoheptulose 1,7-bisphosphatase-like protein